MQVTTRETSAHPKSAGDRREQHQQQQQKQKEPESQLKFVRPAQMSLFADVTCYPPLGQVTYVRRIQKAKGSEAEDTVSGNSLDMKLENFKSHWPLTKGRCILASSFFFFFLYYKTIILFRRPFVQQMR